MERSADGRRSFIVTTYAAFWTRYEGMLPQHRHYYEILRQGWPCHLYFGSATPPCVFTNHPPPGRHLLESQFWVKAQLKSIGVFASFSRHQLSMLAMQH